MDETTYRILDVLSRNLGKPISIHELTSKIQEAYGAAYYANIHEKIGQLSRERMIELLRAGRSSLVFLNFENYLLIDLLAEMELKRKRDFLSGKKEMQMLMMEMDTLVHNMPFIKSVTLMSPQRNAKLNKAELLFQINKSDRKSTEETKISINRITANLQKAYNIRIDHLILEDKDFVDLLRSNENNPAKEMLHNKISALHPQNFWMSISGAIRGGIKIVAEESQTNPAKITEEDLVFNLARFGYVELGSKIKQGRLICIGYIIAAIMFKNDARRMDAIPVILAKNSANYNLVLFLARKYGFEGKILGILAALRNLIGNKMANIDEPVRLLEAMKIKEIRADKKGIKEKLRLYNVA